MTSPRMLLLAVSAVALTRNSVSGFAIPVTRTTATSTSTDLRMSSITPEDWINKPLHQPQSTTPKASEKRQNWLARQTMDDVMIEPDYFLAWSTFLLGPLIMWYHPSYALDGSPSLIGVCGGLFHMLFATLLYVQTLRVRCVFEKDSFEFYNIKGHKLDLDNGARLEEKPANYVSGTQNRWTYDSIINYGFFPSLEYPVICYFKETETPEEQWDKWFAAFDSYGRGQPHFFPGICNARQFKEQMELRGAKRKEIPTINSSKKD